MRSIWLVTKHDVSVTLRQASFWVLTLAMPIVLLVMIVGRSIADAEETAVSLGVDANQESPTTPIPDQIGLVDEAGLIREFPTAVPASWFVRYNNAAEARTAIEHNKVQQVILIPADYLESGNVTILDRNFQIRMSGDEMGLAHNSSHEWVLQYLLDYALVGDENLLKQYGDPLPYALMTTHPLLPLPDTNTATANEALTAAVANLMPFIFYGLLLMGGSYMMRSVVMEKENRTAEIMLLSLDPRDLMVGKLLAMSVLVILQLTAWVGIILIGTNLAGESLNLANFTFPPGFFAWAAAFLLLGFLLYATVMGAVGAMANSPREGSQMMFVLILFLLPTLIAGDLFIDQPQHPLTLALSLFPFSAPSAMVTRLAVGEVSLWQIVSSIGGLILTTYLFILLSARFFHAGNLLSNTVFSFKRLASGWRG